MTIKVGDKLPAATFKVKTADGVKEMTTDEVFKGKKVVLFAVPGAFTPTCSLNHLPGYLDNRDAILAKGVDQIAVVAVNDAFVMGAWAQSTGGEGKILYLADGSAAFTKAAGLELDATAGGPASVPSVIRQLWKTVSSRRSTSKNRPDRRLHRLRRAFSNSFDPEPFQQKFEAPSRRN